MDQAYLNLYKQRIFYIAYYLWEKKFKNNHWVEYTHTHKQTVYYTPTLYLSHVHIAGYDTMGSIQ